MRTVVDLEEAGVVALTIEDSLLPRRYGGAGGPGGEIISQEEFGDKLRAAVAARTDASLTIIGRTEGMPRGLDEALARVQVAVDAGVDAIFARNVTSLEQLKAIHTVAGGIPLVVNSPIAPNEDLAANGVRLMFQGHLPYFVMLRSLYESYQHVVKGGAPSELSEKALPAELQAIALDEAEYARLATEYLNA
jgi:carboxyvinyl-carboxyphosphonate phosphorylmutase